MTMTAPEPPRPTSHSWEVIPIGRSAWRISDGLRAETDSGRLVAYVDQNETGTLEVLWLRNPCPTRSRYRSLDELLAELDAAVTAVETLSRAEQPHRIPHFPPA